MHREICNLQEGAISLKTSSFSPDCFSVTLERTVDVADSVWKYTGLYFVPKGNNRVQM